MTAGWYTSRSPYPLPPTSTSATSPFIKGLIDLRWDNPSARHENEGWLVRGVNIYRSHSSDVGPYRRVNLSPVGGTFYRDGECTETIHDEVVDTWIAFDNQGERPYRFKTKYAISSISVVGEASTSPKDVIVTINGIVVPVMSVFGQTGEVSLAEYHAEDPKNLRVESYPPLIKEGDEVLISYVAYFSDRKVNTGVDRRDYYRISTVAEDPLTGSLYETPLEYCVPFSDREIERIDYMWREGIRRNNWILEQGGERVKLFNRRLNGEPCGCVSFNRETLEYAKQPDSLCTTCFGTGIKGGYDGPYDIIVGPDEGEKRISQEERGRRKEHNYGVWIGPSPIVAQKDFIVKLNNERFSIGAITYSSNRGNILHQAFNIAYLDQGDIRYKVPIHGVPVSWPQTRYSRWHIRETYDARSDAPYSLSSDNSYPMETDRPDKPNQFEVSGRTATWENHNS